MFISLLVVRPFPSFYNFKIKPTIRCIKPFKKILFLAIGVSISYSIEVIQFFLTRFSNLKLFTLRLKKNWFCTNLPLPQDKTIHSTGQNCTCILNGKNKYNICNWQLISIIYLFFDTKTITYLIHKIWLAT